jgi:hypothetical protein
MHILSPPFFNLVPKICNRSRGLSTYQCSNLRNLGLYNRELQWLNEMTLEKRGIIRFLKKSSLWLAT